MKKTKLLSLLLSLSIIFSFAVPGTLAAETDEGGGQTNSGMVYSKTAVPDGDGGYKITLEAYATGSKVITQVTEDVPTDIVLVLDQSGSMDDPMSVTGFLAYVNQSNSYLYNRRHNNTGYGVTRNLYYKLSESSYVEVSVAQNQIPIYTLIEQNGQNQANSYYFTNSNKLYALINGDYQQVTVTLETTDSGWFWPNYKYTYTVNGTTFYTSDDDAANDRPDFTGVEGGRLYLHETDYEYTYTYTVDNVTQTIGTSVGANTQPSDFTLYQSYTNGNISRLNALKSTVASFTSSVSNKAAGEDGVLGTNDDINHRIALVGFASGGSYSQYNDYAYENTEVFIGSTQYRYNNGASGQYGNALQSMDTQTGRNNVTASINALDGYGATMINLGMEMANGILEANLVPAGEQRNRVVIVFTDGMPGTGDYSSTVANAAITQGNNAKAAGATVYTIGVFGGANASSAGNQSGDDTARANWFMQNLSSNNGSVQSPSYYLSAADAATLGGIFQQISNQIETGGSSTTLTEETVIKDIIAPAFTLPEGATAQNITLETWACTGVDGSGAYTWSENPDAMGATATVNGDEVSVTGFDFADNYVGTVTENGVVSYRGHKLVISFTVTPRPNFLGGNGVYTNGSAGIYENGDSTTPILTFDRPTVDVPIAQVSVDAPDINVYLMEQLGAEDLKDGLRASCGEVPLQLGTENFGLEPWQNEYVNITSSITPELPTDGLTADVGYTATVSVSPLNEGTAVERSISDTGNIKVFKPHVSFADSHVYYGDSAPTDFSSNNKGTLWKNGETLSTDPGVEMVGTGTAPELGFEYDLPDGMTTVINGKQDIPVKVTVTLGEDSDVTEYTNFTHTDCNGNCTWTDPTTPGDPAFLLHVNTCTLTITKTGGDNEPYVFTIKKDGNFYTEASITGNDSVRISELPIGTYSIEEDTGWSWRFSADNGSSVTLNGTASSGTVTCSNTKTENLWLNGFSTVVQNIFGVRH